MAGRHAAPQRLLDVLGHVDGDDRRCGCHDLARLLLVEVEDACEHRRLARIELATAQRLLDEHLELLGRLPVVEVTRRPHANDPQDRVRGPVEERDERLEDLREEVERARDEPRRGLGLLNRPDLRDLLAERDVQGGGQQVGEGERDAERHRVRNVVAEQRLDEGRHRRLAEEADGQRGERDAELAGRQVAREVVEQDERGGRALAPLLRVLLEVRAADAHERELGRDEVPVEHHEHEDAEQEQDAHAAARPARSARAATSWRVVVHHATRATVAPAAASATAMMCSPCASCPWSRRPPRCSSPSASATRSPASPTNAITRPRRSTCRRCASRRTASRPARSTRRCASSPPRVGAIYELDEARGRCSPTSSSPRPCAACAPCRSTRCAVADRLEPPPEVISLSPEHVRRGARRHAHARRGRRGARRGRRPRPGRRDPHRPHTARGARGRAGPRGRARVARPRLRRRPLDPAAHRVRGR